MDSQMYGGRDSGSMCRFLEELSGITLNGPRYRMGLHKTGYPQGKELSAPYREVLKVLRHHRFIGTIHPQQLMEPLWFVRDEEALRAWAAAIRLGGDWYECAVTYGTTTKPRRRK